MHGVINVLKPPGMTSHDVVQFIRKLTGQKKVGHTGTLDPGAAGVLPVCLGKATKIIQFMDHNKKYRAEITFGKATSSQDSFGQVTCIADCSSLTLGDIRKGLQEFYGEIEQVPPMTSAVKYEGRKLYELARAGQEVKRKKRKVKVYYARIVEVFGLGTSSPRVMVDIACSAGTYIRTICSDLGENLGFCAYMSFLLRLGAGPFEISESFTLEELQKMKQEGHLSNAVISINRALQNLSAIEIEAAAVNGVRNGNRVSLTTDEHVHLQLEANQLVRIQGPEGIIAIGKTLNESTAGKNIYVQPVKVLV